MGGEGGVEITVPASLQALQHNPELELILVGDEQRLSPLLHNAEQSDLTRFRVLHTDQFITDADKPRNVLRSGRRSSMFMAAELVKSGEVNAMVSAGNTGALLMIGRHLLKTLDGIQKPAIVATIPGAVSQSYLLDVGKSRVRSPSIVRICSHGVGTGGISVDQTGQGRSVKHWL